MNGASVDISFSAYPDFSYSAYGYANANQLVDEGIPESGEHAVLAGFLFGVETNPVILNISGLGDIAAANGIPLMYRVTLLASSPNQADLFLPALVEDNDSNSDSVPFEVFAEHPDYWWPDPDSFRSSGGMGIADGVFTGDNLTISVIGPNETNLPGSGFYTRSSLAGAIITFVPEPTTGFMFIIGAVAGMIGIMRRLR
ncbi:MAG: PEP-CTERM sorting domain-containing protein [Pirellulales bacterium]